MSKSTAIAGGLFLLAAFGVVSIVIGGQLPEPIVPDIGLFEPEAHFVPEPADPEVIEETEEASVHDDTCPCRSLGHKVIAAQPTAAGCCGTSVGHSHGCRKCCPWYFNSSFDMPPHYPYYPAMHGYYYFRPYHPAHLVQQRALVETWGGDPRNPYANRIFQTVYEDYRADKADNADVPLTVPAPEPETNK